jgi:hypothetical protein
VSQLRELRQVGTKMAYVLVPRRNKNLLRDCASWVRVLVGAPCHVSDNRARVQTGDLWGPLFLCLALAVYVPVPRSHTSLLVSVRATDGLGGLTAC